MWNKDITPWLWWVVAAVLVYDGATHAVTGTVWGRIRGLGIAPVIEGWPVVALGIVEAAFGLYLGYRLLLLRSR